MHFCFSVLQNTNAGDTVLRSHIKKILNLLEEIKTREVKSDDGSVKVYNNVYRTKGPEADPQSKEERRSSLHATSDLRIYAKGPPGLHFKRDHPSEVHIINQENLNKRYGEVKAKWKYDLLINSENICLRLLVPLMERPFDCPTLYNDHGL